MREAKKLSQPTVAEKAGFSIAVISQTEQGANMPTLGNFCAWAGALGLDVVLRPEGEK